MSLKKIVSVALFIVMVAGCFMFAACANDETKEEKLKVAFIYIGSAADGGYSTAHDNGRKYMLDQIGSDKVETIVYENVSEDGTACAEKIDAAVDAGAKLIFTTSFGFQNATKAAADKYKDVKFMHCSGSEQADNMGNYFGRMYQARYLAGIAAGLTLKQGGKIGYVAAMQIPECIRMLNAFTIGVRAVNPTAVVKVVWTNTWYDLAVEKEAAEGLIAAGCDMIAQHQDTPEPVKAAEKAGKYSLGYNCSMASYAPEYYVTSPIWNWGPYYTKIVQSVLDDTWKSESYWGGINDNVIKLDAYGKVVTQETKDAVAVKEQLLKSGTWDVFYGPVKAQDGTVKIAEGTHPTDAELLSMNWLVEGVEGSLD